MSQMLSIITGASSGIGAELAQQAEAVGHTVATVSRRPGPGHHLAADLSATGSRFSSCLSVSFRTLAVHSFQ